MKNWQGRILALQEREIISGELIVAPRPAPIYMNVATILGKEIGSPYRLERGGPCGWIFLDKTGIRIGEDTVVPDLAGWRKEWFPTKLEHNWIEVAPDWRCKVLPQRRIALVAMIHDNRHTRRCICLAL